MKKQLAKLMGLGALALALSSGASAFFVAPKVHIEKNVNAPVITVKVQGTGANLAELRINGESVGTRTLDPSDKLSELNFNVDLTNLSDGDNKIEVRLFDEDGRLLGTEVSNISVDAGLNSPVEVAFPKNGATLQGLVELRLNLKREMVKPMVSFMINGQWKAVRNFTPYTYVWDTEGVENGWHEVQIWVVDASQTTFKSRKVRVFVNNPGGRTDRILTPSVDMNPIAHVAAMTPAMPKVRSMSVGYAMTMAKPAISTITKVSSKPMVTGTRALLPTGKRVVMVKTAGPKVNAPKPTAVGKTLPKVTAKATPVVKPVPKTTAVKPIVAKTPTISIRPTGSKPVGVKTAPVKAIQSVTITKGTRLPNNSAIKMVYNGSLLTSDVPAFITSGIPVAPFRHLVEKEGGKLSWFAAEKRVQATGLGDMIELRIGSDKVLVGDKQLRMEVEAFIRKGRTIVPMSFLTEALKVKIDYDPKTGHVLITKN